MARHYYPAKIFNYPENRAVLPVKGGGFHTIFVPEEDLKSSFKERRWFNFMTKLNIVEILLSSDSFLIAQCRNDSILFNSLVTTLLLVFLFFFSLSNSISLLYYIRLGGPYVEILLSSDSFLIAQCRNDSILFNSLVTTLLLVFLFFFSLSNSISLLYYIRLGGPYVEILLSSDSFLIAQCRNDSIKRQVHSDRVSAS